MKGGLVILVAALEALEEAGLDASWGVIFNSDEETGSYHSDRAIREEAAAGYAAGLVVEPALPDGSLVTHRPGSGQFMVEARGTPAHVGRDFLKGASAISALAAMIGKIDQLGDPVPPPNGRGLIVNVGVIEGGTATNVVAESARAWGNIRFPDTAAGSALEGQLLAMAHGDNGSKLQMTVRTSVNRPAKPLTAATQALAESARAAAIDLGQAMPFATTGGVCDGNNMQSAGLPTIDTLGVRGGGLHTPQEWIELRSLVERCQLLAVMVGRLSAGT
jgi:glutamate carboxypeptidase